MAASRDTIRETINRYVDYIAKGTTDQILSLFAAGATVEDPVGSEVRTTRESIREFYAQFEGRNPATTLGPVKIAGDRQAAFSFEVTVQDSGMTYTIAPIDVMTFDDDGLITSMRAFWGDEDLAIS